MKRHFGLLIAVLLLLTLALPLAAQEEAYFPTTEWRTSTPEEQGMDSTLLAEVIEQVPSLGLVDSVMVVRNGYVVAEAYWHPFPSGLHRELFSTSKSVLSALVGIAIDKGYIRSLDQKVLEFFPGVEVGELDDNKREMTLRHLLTMTSGFDCDMPGGTDFFILKEPDGTQLGLSWPMADAPGTTFRYCQINVYLLSNILEKAAGMDILSFARLHLFDPLGITDVDWNISAEGLPLGYVGLMMNPRDMAKIGYLFLNNGRWEGTQILPADWVTASIENTDPEIPIPGIGYGYLWWLFDTPAGDFFEAAGLFNQIIDVASDQNLVMVYTGTDNNFLGRTRVDQVLTMSILNTVKSDQPLSANPQGVARLQAAIHAAANPTSQPVDALPALAATISGKTYQVTTPDFHLPDTDFYQMSQQDWNIATLGLDFGESSAVLRLQTESGINVNVPVGLDRVYRVATSPFGTLATLGEWRTETRFILLLRRMEAGLMLQYTLNFTDDGFTGLVDSARPGDGFAPPPGRLGGQLMP